MSARVIIKWAQHDTTQATAWLDRLPQDSGRWAATEGFVYSVMDTDPDAALGWVRSIPDEDRRTQLLQRSWERWKLQNASSADEWLRSAELNENERKALTESANGVVK